MRKSGQVAAFVIIAVFVMVPVTSAERMMGGGMMKEGKMCGMMGRMPKTGVDPENLPEASSEGARAYAKFCSQCHVLPSPKRHSTEEWKKLVDRMDGRMRMMSRKGGGMMGMMRGMMGGRRTKAMSATEKKMVTGYLQSHALKTLDRSSVASFDTPEFRAFEKVCSQCHDLPDPSAHTQSEWPRVVQKMVGNMKDAAIEPPGHDEKKALLRFLQDNTGS